MTDWRGGFVAVDWGMTHRRIYLVRNGTIEDFSQDDLGVFSVPSGGFEAAVAALKARFSGRPLLLAGMIGSEYGWMHVPYVPCPAGLDAIAAGVRWVEPGRVGIVPGLSLTEEGRVDIMRGQEVQLLGLAAMGMLSDHATICQVGSHSKWVEVADGQVLRFQTIMTGELFGLLRRHSLLAPLIGGDVRLGDAFLDGVERGFADGGMGAELFSVRAGVVLGTAAGADAASFISGLLIGCDVRSGLSLDVDGDVAVVGTPALRSLFVAALDHCGRTPRQVERDQAFVAGVSALALAIS
jgi:2-dehydro-3-deoxygalactonokinase